MYNYVKMLLYYTAAVALIAILYFGYLENKEKNPFIPDALAPSLLIPRDYSSNSGFDGGGIFHDFPLLI